MPPRRRKSAIDTLARLAEKAGVDFSKLMDEVSETEIGPQAVLRKEMEAEAVLFYVERKGSGFKPTICKHCKGEFLHTYLGVSYCSDECRAVALAEIGINWNFERRRDSDRWNVKGKGLIPRIIGVSATAALKESGNYNG